jgi:hypothetical protein
VSEKILRELLEAGNRSRYGALLAGALRLPQNETIKSHRCEVEERALVPFCRLKFRHSAHVVPCALFNVVGRLMPSTTVELRLPATDGKHLKLQGELRMQRLEQL